ncbi:hypothetical protein BCV72DRAFT_323163, partial [Rhizopus microsporus var. microsporus]
MYAGVLGIPYMKGLQRHVNYDRVRQIFDDLCEMNPRLNAYRQDDMQRLYAKFSLSKMARTGEPIPRDSWPVNYLMPIADLPPRMAEIPLEDLPIGNLQDFDVKLRDHPDFLVLLFPYLYTNGRGYYSLCSDPRDGKSEAEGGYAMANQYQTFSKYVKQRLLLADRRFGRCPEFIFFC